MEQTSAASTAPAATSGCFDCNICLDFAAEPVVTLCGHLYCWPCIYKWLSHSNVHTGQCPVCKASVSEESLVPLYGRGQSFKEEDHLKHQIPRRPQPQRETNANQPNVAQHHEYVYPMSAPVFSPVIHSTAGGVLGGVALAVLPWLMRNGAGHIPASLFYTSPYHFVAVGRQRRQEQAMEKLLHQLCIFLFVFALLCLLLF